MSGTEKNPEPVADPLDPKELNLMNIMSNGALTTILEVLQELVRRKQLQSGNGDPHQLMYTSEEDIEENANYPQFNGLSPAKLAGIHKEVDEAVEKGCMEDLVKVLGNIKTKI